jgi:transposase
LILERHRPVDLLPDREAETLSARLKAHPGVEVVSCDRSLAYASGDVAGAPNAVQIADRWHLLKNLRKALEQFLKRVLPTRVRRTKGPAYPTEEPAGTTNVYLERIRVRLLPHLLVRGASKGSKRAPPLRPPPPREAAWMLLQTEQFKEEERAVIERLCQLFPVIKEAQELALGFTRMVRQRSAERLPAGLRAVAKSKLKEFMSFARGLGEDYEAVRNALRYDWSNGQLEGQVNRLN